MLVFLTVLEVEEMKFLIVLKEVAAVAAAVVVVEAKG